MEDIRRVLIIDDDVAHLYLIQLLLKEVGFTGQVYTALNGQEAIDILKQQYLEEKENVGTYLPDLILLDINMPVMNGFEFLEELERINHLKQKHCVVVMLTSSINPLDIERAKRYPIDDYIEKPLTEEKLTELNLIKGG